jgi:hypothetical protein
VRRIAVRIQAVAEVVAEADHAEHVLDTAGHERDRITDLDPRVVGEGSVEQDLGGIRRRPAFGDDRRVERPWR